MALIRGSNTGVSLKDAIALNLGDVTREAESVVARARQEAERVLADAAAQRRRMIESASAEGAALGHAEGLARGREQGSAAGHAQALAEFRQRLADLESAWGQTLGWLTGERARLLADARTDVVRLAARLAETLTKRRLDLDPALVIDQVEAVLRLVAKPTALRIAVHPEDERLLRDAMPGLLARLPMADHVDLATDASLRRGSCVATTVGGGTFDASIQGQLERIAEALLPAGGDGAPPRTGP
ncbi:MAG: hypothetical protein FJ255_04580 [Phycisphaerae bacterium]|nr:hypothetical protein [Phycisphaerae bacterium]